MLAAGLEGIAENLDPGEPVSEQTYDWTRGSSHAARRPRNLLEAIEVIEAIDADPLVHDVLPAGFVREYVEMKHAEWESYHSEISAWERRRYLLDL
jgi:glutamine synthetase